jgi:hypothetical protein
MEAYMCRLPFAVLFLVASVSAASAVEVKTLYRAETIVTGVEEPERTRGFRAGLTDVIVKLTGDVRLAGSDALKPLLDKPHPFVEAFEYEDRMKDIPVHDEQGTRDRPHFLRMKFKSEAVDDELRSLGLSRWGSDRPMLAVWLGIRTAVGAYILTSGGEDGYGQRAVLTETAERRGVPILLPDAGAHAAVTFDDIGSEKLHKLEDASPMADALLSGVLSITETGYWTMIWRLDWKGRTRTWGMEEVSFDTALKDGLQTSALIFSGHEPM